MTRFDILLERVIERVEWAGPGGTCLFCRQPAPCHYADCIIPDSQEALKKAKVAK